MIEHPLLTGVFFMPSKIFSLLAVNGLYYIISGMSTHNVDYYINLLGKFEQFKADNRTRQRNSSLVNPQRLLINPIADFATDLVFIPSKWAYLTTGKALVGATGLFHSALAGRIEAAWRDPISTNTMVKIGRFIQSTALVNAVRKPTSVPFLHFFDRALIAFTQHTCVVTTDLIELLKIPENLHDYIDSERAQAGEAKPSTTLAGKGWQYVKFGLTKVKDAVYALIVLVVKAVRVPLKQMPVVEKALKKTGELLENARNSAHAFILHKAHELIDHGESKVRHQMTSHVASIVCRQTIRSAIGAGLHVAVGTSAYLLANYAFTQYTGAQEFPPEMVRNASRVLKVVGGYLWVRCITPALRDLYDDYNNDFKPDSSTLVEVANILSIKNIRPLVALAKKKLDIK